jgi:hypothetical protein
MKIAVVSTLLLCAAPFFAADETMLRLVPPDATSLAGADIERVKNSALATLYFDLLQQGGKDMERFAAASGFDPQRDIQEVIVASPMFQRRSASMGASDVFIVRGAFDENRIIGTASVFGGIPSIYRGVKVLTPPKGQSFEIAFLGNIAVGAAPLPLRAAIDRHIAKAPLGEAALRAQSASRRYDAWGISGALGQLGFLPPHSRQGGSPATNTLSAIESVTAGLRFGDLVSVSAEAIARTEKDATALVDLYRMAAMMMQSQQHEKAAEFGKVLESVSASTEGKTARFSASVPAEFIEKWFRPRQRRGVTPAVHVSPKPAALR